MTNNGPFEKRLGNPTIRAGKVPLWLLCAARVHVLKVAVLGLPLKYCAHARPCCLHHVEEEED